MGFIGSLPYKKDAIYGGPGELGMGIVKLIDEFAGTKRIIPNIYWFGGNSYRFIAAAPAFHEAITYEMELIIEMTSIHSSKNLARMKSLQNAFSQININNVMNDVREHKIFESERHFIVFRELAQLIGENYRSFYNYIYSINKIDAEIYEEKFSNYLKSINNKIAGAVSEYKQYQKPTSSGIFGDVQTLVKVVTYGVPIIIGTALFLPLLINKRRY